jgi:hypothetical protein
LFPDSETILAYDSTDDAPDTAKLLEKDVKLTSTLESLSRMLPPMSDAAMPENSEATIEFFFALLRPPTKLIAAPEKEELCQNLVAITDMAALGEDASK